MWAGGRGENRPTWLGGLGGNYLGRGLSGLTAIGSEVARCHLHTKPLLSCKFCRKFKMAVHQQAKLAQLQGASQQQKEGALEMTNSTTFNLNPLLRENILSSEYYKSLYSYSSLNDMLTEIRQYVDHLEPYVAGNARAPSTFICCLHKLFTLKLTEDELLTMTEDRNIFVRSTAYVWLRFVHPPHKLWDWFESVLLDDEVFIPAADKSAQNEMTFGLFLENLLTGDRYFSTVLPRLPAKVKTLYSMQVYTLPAHRNRKERNLNRLWKFKRGVDVLACHRCEWREGIFLDFYQEDADSQKFAMIKFECEDESVPIDLGLVIVLSHRHKKRKTQQQTQKAEIGEIRDHPEDQELTPDYVLTDLRRREQEKATVTTGKDYAKRPFSYKASLSLSMGNNAVPKTDQ